jgi:hypothetical protein
LEVFHPSLNSCQKLSRFWPSRACDLDSHDLIEASKIVKDFASTYIFIFIDYEFHQCEPRKQRRLHRWMTGRVTLCQLTDQTSRQAIVTTRKLTNSQTETPEFPFWSGIFLKDDH